MEAMRENYEWYKAHQGELSSRYGGQFIVIKDCEVVGVYDTPIRRIL